MCPCAEKNECEGVKKATNAFIYMKELGIEIS